ncbi:YedE family putative selenium metabolism protein [Lachnospiraceae bacterium PF1-21]
MSVANSKWKLLVIGAVCGLIAVCLAIFGNPANMAFCIACFIRDTAGALGLHQAEVVQYARPETIGLVIGAFLISFATKEYKSTGGSSPMIRFILGFCMMVGALIFLGCPLRMILRMSAGDLTAWIALIGFILGIGTGVIFLKGGFSLGRAYETSKLSGMVISLLSLAILLLAVGTNLLKQSTAGPGSMHAPIIMSLIGGLLFGALAQKARICFAGSIRDVILLRNFDLLSAVVGLFIVMLIYNLASGNFTLGMNTPGIIAHSEHLWNILGMYVVGLAAVLAGGCPLRQLILAGQGSNDSAVTVLGMLIGAAICHNFGLASSGTSVNPETKELIKGAVTTNGKVACIICIVVLLVIAFVSKRQTKAASN